MLKIRKAFINWFILRRDKPYVTFHLKSLIRNIIAQVFFSSHSYCPCTGSLIFGAHFVQIIEKSYIFILRCLVRPVETTQNRTWRHLNDIPMQIGGLCLNGFHDVVGANVFSVLLNKNVAPQRGVWNSTTMRLMLPCYVHQSRLTEDSKTCIFSMYIDLVQAKTESFFIYF